MNDNAAYNLLGQTLKNGWKVIEKISKDDNSTGAFFSVCYKVEKENEICFLKAFDFAKFFAIAGEGREVVDVMNDMLTAYKYERDLSNHCRNKHVTKVSFVKESGEEVLTGYTYSIVPYLIFDMADGDVRKKMSFSRHLDYAWRFSSLHDIAVGLKQLHTIDVSHQDLKPSNILVYNNECKLGDLGRSMCKDVEGPFNKWSFSGDRTYAPPEILYRYFEIDWNKRVFATDCYLLGSMVVFYFAGISMSALLKKYIPMNFYWEFWTGSFEEIRPYLENAFSASLDEFESNITENRYKRQLREMVEYLCHPLPEKRGHPRNIFSKESNYSLERFITRFNVLKNSAEIYLRTELNGQHI